MSNVRVRFAPSPTGYLHVGGARTALFNWLHARKTAGIFVLRIEDTDVERSSAEMVEGILDGLRWLGLDWDEGPGVGGEYGPYFQSQRLERYRAMIAQLVQTGHAYHCYCTPDELQQRREAALARGENPQYDRACLRRSAEEVAALVAAGAPRAVRFKVPDGEIRFTDLVRGEIKFDHTSIEDFVILRSDDNPTYHLSVVVDDVDMRITLVLRGEDHISNTPKHVLLYRAFGAHVPQFAHVPLILGADKKRLSKRHGATSVMEYARSGYLPEAMVNFLALLGWSPGDDRELFSMEELVQAFTVEGIAGGNAVFNADKLDWFNGQHIMRLSAGVLVDRIESRLREAGLWDEAFAAAGARREWLQQVIELLKPRAKKLDDFITQLRPFLTDVTEYDEAAVKKHWAAPETAELLETIVQRLGEVQPFETAGIEAVMRGLADERQMKAPAVIHPVRLAVTGVSVSPGLFEVLALLGRDTTLTRLRRAIAHIRPAA